MQVKLGWRTCFQIFFNESWIRELRDKGNVSLKITFNWFSYTISLWICPLFIINVPSLLQHASAHNTRNLLLEDLWRFLTLSGPGWGVQRPGWPDSQLPIRNLLFYDAQTWWLLVFILNTPYGQILAKLVNQGGCCSFLIETSQTCWKWKIFPLLKKNDWNWHGGSILGREERFWT